MSNVIPLHSTWLPEPEWFGPYEISIGLSHTGETLEAIIDRDDDDNPVIIVPPTPLDGPVGYTLTDEQAAELTDALYTAMSPSARALFHQQLGASS